MRHPLEMSSLRLVVVLSAESGDSGESGGSGLSGEPGGSHDAFVTVPG